MARKITLPLTEELAKTLKAGDELLVTGDSRCAEHYDVLGSNLDLIVLGEGYSVERRHRLALASRRDEGEL